MTCGCPSRTASAARTTAGRLITNQLNHERVTLCSTGVVERSPHRDPRVGAVDRAARRPAGGRPGVGAAQPGPASTPSSTSFACSTGSRRGRRRRASSTSGTARRSRCTAPSSTSRRSGSCSRSSARPATSPPGTPGGGAALAARRALPGPAHPHVRRRHERGPARPDLDVLPRIPESEPLMDFSFDSDQQELQSLTRRILADPPPAD